MKIVGNHTVRLAACPGLPWRPFRSAGDSACIFVYPLCRGLGKTRDNPRHDIFGHRRRQHPSQVGVVRRSPPRRSAHRAWCRVPRPHRPPGRKQLGPIACAHAHAGLRGGRGRCQAPGAGADGANGALGRGAAMGGVVGRRGGAYQRLRPPFAPGLRPLGGDGGRAPPCAGPGPGTAAGGGDGGHRRDGGMH